MWGTLPVEVSPMRTNLPQRHLAGLAAAGVVMAGIIAAALTFGPHRSGPDSRTGQDYRVDRGSLAVQDSGTARQSPPGRAVPPEPARLAFGSSPDLNGDSRPDSIRRNGDTLTVTAGQGDDLLRFEAPGLLDYQVARLEGEYPVLFIQTAPGEWAAFTYSPGAGLLQAVTWPDGAMRGYGGLTEDGALSQAVVGSGLRTRVVRMRLSRFQLENVETVWRPISEARRTPADALAAAVEAAALGLKAEMAVHFPDPAQAAAFYAKWHGTLPPGRALVAMADEVDAGAIHGHKVPVTVWVAGETGVAGIRGEAEFASGPGGVQIMQANLEAIPLQVRSWDEAGKRLKAARPGAGPVQRAQAPFYGTFRFVAGDRRYGVNAATGEVADE